MFSGWFHINDICDHIVFNRESEPFDFTWFKEV